jgi:hypothetical protein
MIARKVWRKTLQAQLATFAFMPAMYLNYVWVMVNPNYLSITHAARIVSIHCIAYTRIV